MICETDFFLDVEEKIPHWNDKEYKLTGCFFSEIQKFDFFPKKRSEKMGRKIFISILWENIFFLTS